MYEIMAHTHCGYQKQVPLIGSMSLKEAFLIGCRCPGCSSGDWCCDIGLHSEAAQRREGLHGIASVFHHPATAHI